VGGIRGPGSLGQNGKVDPIDAGTLCKSRMPTPGVSGNVRSQQRMGSNRSGVHSPAAQIPKFGDRGTKVRELQALLNSRLDLSPPLRLDGHYGMRTRRAVGKVQATCDLQVDGIAGPVTWYRLLSAAGHLSRADVSTWSLFTKVREVVRRASRELPHELWTQLRSMISTDFLVLALALFAASQLTGAGEIIDVGIIVIIGAQVFFELAAAVQITVLAGTESELDEAGAHLAQAIATAGVASFVIKLAKFVGAKGGVKVEELNNGSTPLKLPEQKRLYRAVDSVEKASINRVKAFTPSPNGSSVKGFFFERADAQDFANKIAKVTGKPHAVIEADAPSSLVDSSSPHRAAGEGPGIYISTDDLWQLEPKD
jgi:Putative peptidoglycan binding domain